MKATTAILAVFSALLMSVLLAAGCGSSKNGSGFDDGDNSAGGDGGFGEGGKGFGGGSGEGGSVGCHGIGCNVVSCPSGGDTTISGTVYAPNGTLPLYNVIVFVPTDPLAPLTEGVSCDTCGKVSGNPVTSTVSGADGKFTLKGVPTGTNIPLVFQVGKWRRQVTIPAITSCTDNPVTDPNMSRLPKNHTEGDIPHIAVTTGTCDNIACVLPKMGIDASEYGVQSTYADHRVVMYEGSGPAAGSGITKAQNLWGDANELKKYDVAIFSCECSEHYDTKPAPAQQNVYDYLNEGGRTFGTDFMYTWIHTGNETSADPAPADLSPILEGFVGGAPGGNSGQYDINTSFPKGAALDTWLQAVGGSTTAGKVALSSVWSNYSKADPSLAQTWVSGITGSGDNQDRVISYTTPFSEPDESKRCGKSYYLDVHVGDATGESVGSSFPSGCGSTLTAQEKMMVFFLFDLASCIQDDTSPVNPPR